MVRFKTNEVADLIGVPLTTLTEWIQKQWIVPTRRGWRGVPSLFDARLTLALAMIAANHQSHSGCWRNGLCCHCVERIVDHWQGMDEDALAVWLDQRDMDYWESEAVAALASTSPAPPVGEDAVLDDIMRRLTRVTEAIKARLAAGEGETEEDLFGNSTSSTGTPITRGRHREQRARAEALARAQQRKARG
jgi:hypothetical protein